VNSDRRNNVVNSPTNVRGGTNITGPTYNTAVNRSPTVGNFNRPYAGNYGGWYHGGWGGWNRYPGVWGGLAAGGLAAGALSSWGYGDSFQYANPYYEDWASTAATAVDAVASAVPAALDYSTPIPVPTATQVSNTDVTIVDDGMAYFDRGRTYFMDGKYAEATAEAERAVKLLRGDRTIHEFRALCLFARKNYREAAATLYAVLVGGPGWDWDTMSALYPDNDTYTQQLRSLEKYAREHPRDAQAQFLLGYHYMVLDEREDAREAFAQASKLQPKDKLSAQLADALSAKAPAESSDRE
jgi:tetratricopeptide (TPR) repeat protein